MSITYKHLKTIALMAIVACATTMAAFSATDSGTRHSLVYDRETYMVAESPQSFADSVARQERVAIRFHQSEMLKVFLEVCQEVRKRRLAPEAVLSPTEWINAETGRLMPVSYAYKYYNEQSGSSIQVIDTQSQGAAIPSTDGHYYWRYLGPYAANDSNPETETSRTVTMSSLVRETPLARLLRREISYGLGYYVDGADDAKRLYDGIVGVFGESRITYPILIELYVVPRGQVVMSDHVVLLSFDRWNFRDLMDSFYKKIEEALKKTPHTISRPDSIRFSHEFKEGVVINAPSGFADKKDR